MKKSFQQKLQEDIIELLILRPMSTNEISVKLKANYHTVRKAMRILQDEGMIKPMFNRTMRDVKYMIGEDAGENSSIPVILTGGRRDNMFKFVGADFTNTRGMKAFMNLPDHVFSLMVYARRASNGAEVELNLQTRKEAMIMDRDALANAVEVYNQIIDNPRNWNSNILKRYVNDAAYNMELIDEMIEKENVLEAN